MQTGMIVAQWLDPQSNVMQQKVVPVSQAIHKLLASELDQTVYFREIGGLFAVFYMTSEYLTIRFVLLHFFPLPIVVLDLKYNLVSYVCFVLFYFNV